MPSRRRHVGDYSRRQASPKESIKMMTFCLARLPTNVDAAAYSGGVLGPNASIETACTDGHTHGRRDGGIAPPGDASDADGTFQRWAVVATMTDRNWPPVDRANRASPRCVFSLSSSSFSLPSSRSWPTCSLSDEHSAARTLQDGGPNGGPGKRKNAGRARHGRARARHMER